MLLLKKYCALAQMTLCLFDRYCVLTPVLLTASARFSRDARRIRCGLYLKGSYSLITDSDMCTNNYSTSLKIMLRMEKKNFSGNVEEEEILSSCRD